jgi:hypothetical protein
MADYPLYRVQVDLDNGVSFSAEFGPLPGLPGGLDDEIAATAARAIRDFGWAQVPVTPPASSAVVTLTRQDVANTAIGL